MQQWYANVGRRRHRYRDIWPSQWEEEEAYLAPVARLAGAVGDALLARARALVVEEVLLLLRLGVVLVLQVVARGLRRHLVVGARLAVVVHWALHWHGAGVVV